MLYSQTKFYHPDVFNLYLKDLNYLRNQYNKGMFDLGNFDDFVYDLNEDNLNYIVELLDTNNLYLSHLISLRCRFFKVINNEIVPVTIEEMLTGVYQLNTYFDVVHTNAHKYVINGGYDDYEMIAEFCKI